MFAHISFPFRLLPEHIQKTNELFLHLLLVLGALFLVKTLEAQCTATGQILLERWDNIGGSRYVNRIPVQNPPTSTAMLNIFEIPKNQGNRYGVRVRGYICPPQTGNYTFWIASNDHGELWLSSDEFPANKSLIAYVIGSTDSRVWTKYPSQQSAEIFLESGKRYYIEALMKEKNGNDNLAVAWQLPDGTFTGPISGDYLSPFPVTNVKLDVKVFLQAAYSSNTGLMSDHLRTLIDFPIIEPYTSLGYQHVLGGGERIKRSRLNVSGNNAIVDWVFLELRKEDDPTKVLATRSALLLRNGDVVDVDGFSPVQMMVDSGSYYVGVRHRNHLAIMSQNPIALHPDSAYTTVNFYDISNGIPTWGVHAQEDFFTNIRTMWAGDANGDNVISLTGSQADVNGISLKVILDPSNTTFSTTFETEGYYIEDTNMNGKVTMAGIGSDVNPISINVFLHPFNVDYSPSFVLEAQVP